MVKNVYFYRTVWFLLAGKTLKNNKDRVAVDNSKKSLPINTACIF